MAAEKEKETIIKDPLENDVLLGQGHYRHPGNQRLNKIVDSKVHEYQHQSRPFKTYMAHDIIQRLRNKGTRFLKELAPKGWIVVKDDKEAREKVAQRFQYIMRKQAENPPAVKEQTAAAKAKTGMSPTEFIPVPQPNLVWNGTTVRVPFLPCFHQLQRSSVVVDDDINAVSQRLLECFKIIDVEESFNYEQANAELTVPDNLKVQLNLWKPLGGNRGVIVELVNLVGDVITFQKYSRYILEAATGLFDRYKHTLCQSRRLTASSVQDKVTSYAANLAAGKRPPGRSPAADENISIDQVVIPEVKPGTVKLASDRVLRDAKNKRARVTLEAPDKKEKTKPTVKRPSVKRIEQNPPLIDNQCKRKSPEPIVEKESMTGIFASAFSRWETGIEATDKTSETPMTGSFASAFSRWETGIEATDKTVAPVARTTKPRRWSAAKTKESRSSPVRTTEPFPVPYFAVTVPTVPRRQSQPCGFEGCHVDKPAPTVDSLEGNTESIRRLSLSAAEGAVDETEPEGEDVFKPYPLDRWSVAESHQEMKCDSSIEDKEDSETAFMDHAVESIKRMSVTSNDASYAGPRVRGDLFEAFPAGLWSAAVSNQEMKCDGSFDNDPFADGSISSTQSFIPSSFFEPAATGARASLKTANAPSPANSFCSHISVEMRSLPSPSASFNSKVSIDVFSLPSPAGSFNSRCSLGMNSLINARMDETLSPSMFQSDLSANKERSGAPDVREGRGGEEESLTVGADLPQQDTVPPAIFVESCSALVGPSG